MAPGTPTVTPANVTVAILAPAIADDTGDATGAGLTFQPRGDTDGAGSGLERTRRTDPEAGRGARGARTGCRGVTAPTVATAAISAMSVARVY
jgi:hypothetical protein